MNLQSLFAFMEKCFCRLNLDKITRRITHKEATLRMGFVLEIKW